MAKITNPLFSFGASGTIGKVLTFNQAERIPTARMKPDNTAKPSSSQLDMRKRFSDAAKTWRGLAPASRLQWQALAAGRGLTPMAKYWLEWMAQGSTLAMPPFIPMR